MEHEIKYCPFCSGEAFLGEKLTYGGGKLYGVACLTPMCPGSTPQWCLDADSAIELWNEREEPTVHVESSHLEREIGDYTYIEVELSCGHEFTWDDGYLPRYCPYCGARVEADELGEVDG